jgi:hypothetical protein
MRAAVVPAVENINASFSDNAVAWHVRANFGCASRLSPTWSGRGEG